MNDAEFESMRGQVNDSGVPFEQQYFKREVTPKVFDGKVSVPVANSLVNTYGNDFYNEYKSHVEAAKGEPGSLDKRSSLVNLSAIIRQKQAQGEAKDTDGGHASEVGTPGAVQSNDGGFKVEDEGGHVTNFSSKEEAKAYYLKILRSRLEKIAKKYGIQFDPEFIALFENDDFFLNGKVPSLEEYADLEKIDKAWQTADVITDLPSEIDKTIEENYNAMKTVKETVLKHGDAALYQSVMADSDKIDEFLKKAKESAVKDQKFFNEQKIKEKVEVAILCIVSHEVERYPQMTELIDVLKDTIKKRTEYMEKETKEKKNARDLRTKAIQAGSFQAATEFKDQCDHVVSLLDTRRSGRERLVFGSSPAKLVKNPDDPVIATANPVTNYVEPVEQDLGKRPMVLKPVHKNPIDTTSMAA